MKEVYYPIMDKPYKKLLFEELEDETVPLAEAVARTFYKAKGEIYAYTIGSYQNARFTKRIKRFEKQEELLSPKQIKDFYLSINENKLDILFELFEKARTSTYDLHAKILAKLYVNLISNGNLDYHESTFLANINIMNDTDLIKFYELLDELFNKKGLDIDNTIIKQEKLEFETKTYRDIYIYDKLLRVGLIMDTSLGKGKDLAMYGGDSKDFYIHNFTKLMYLILKEILGD
ncbi:hypothetical protein AMRN_0927 [Malaciobacter marinus]|uniref:Uncharacterized protein n=1 Tax=Malaciobacter marinus TaxID=505249 RepID=A0A347TJA1_9BACT|nr:hypothetical protein [Malaciobacter marinus]AXX86679.1 hypothetical protein AMRN_0927 [Malaciobacter marinus]PHO14723.1 hypothetical protein CPH92_10635 [Malaciobacter marinus]